MFHLDDPGHQEWDRKKKWVPGNVCFWSGCSCLSHAIEMNAVCQAHWRSFLLSRNVQPHVIKYNYVVHKGAIEQLLSTHASSNAELNCCPFLAGSDLRMVEEEWIWIDLELMEKGSTQCTLLHCGDPCLAVRQNHVWVHPCATVWLHWRKRGQTI